MAANMTTFKFQEYVPDKKDICSLCGGNVGEHDLVSCRDEIMVCPGCIDLLVDIKKERQAEREAEAVQAMMDIEQAMHDAYQPRELIEAILRAARENKIPRIQVNF
jgi:hypothetical protein